MGLRASLADPAHESAGARVTQRVYAIIKPWRHVRALLKNARSAAALTGAGVSAESGIPTFRGAHGLWRQFRAEDLATAEAFARDPKLVWEWYDWRRGLIAKARPNTGHYALAQLQERTADFTLITQNVDDLHDAAGSRNVVKLHGSIWKTRCVQCGIEQVDGRTPLPRIHRAANAAGCCGRPWYGSEKLFLKTFGVMLRPQPNAPPFFSSSGLPQRFIRRPRWRWSHNARAPRL